MVPRVNPVLGRSSPLPNPTRAFGSASIRLFLISLCNKHNEFSAGLKETDTRLANIIKAAVTPSLYLADVSQNVAPISSASFRPCSVLTARFGVSLLFPTSNFGTSSEFPMPAS